MTKNKNKKLKKKALGVGFGIRKNHEKSTYIQPSFPIKFVYPLFTVHFLQLTLWRSFWKLPRMRTWVLSTVAYFSITHSGACLLVLVKKEDKDTLRFPKMTIFLKKFYTFFIPSYVWIAYHLNFKCIKVRQKKDHILCKAIFCSYK